MVVERHQGQVPRRPEHDPGDRGVDHDRGASRGAVRPGVSVRRSSRSAVTAEIGSARGDDHGGAAGPRAASTPSRDPGPEAGERLGVVVVVAAGRPPRRWRPRTTPGTAPGRAHRRSPGAGRRARARWSISFQRSSTVGVDRPAGGLRRQLGGPLLARMVPCTPGRALHPRAPASAWPRTSACCSAERRTARRSPRHPTTPGRAGPAGSGPSAVALAAASGTASRGTPTAGPKTAYASLVVCRW